MTDKERIELKECWDSGSHNAYRIRIAELEARVKARAAECGKEGDMKKHAWLRNTTMKRMFGITGTCLDCGESRFGSLRGGVCPGSRKRTKRGGGR